MKIYPIFFLSFAGCFSSLFAAPSGFEVVSGSAAAPVEVSLGHTLIESNGNAVINWDSFSIGVREALTFSQASSDHYVLNQVVGPFSSDILGSLSSNGAVYLINPNGIFIGPDAVIETAGFLASTLDLCKEKMAEGVFSFSGSSEAAIVNQGTIRAPHKEIYLIARYVDNQGVIEAENGTAVLSTPDILIEKGNFSKVVIRPLEPLNIKEDQELLAENPYAFAICQKGAIKAQEVHLLAEGNILVEGEVDASSPQGGGAVTVHADGVGVGPDAHLAADATTDGDGGKILLLGREQVRFFGTLSARGGESSGDGGFIEISAPYLIKEGPADLRAPFGRFGTLLIDPSDVVISTDPTSGGVNLTTNPATLPADNTVTINNTDLTNQLQLSNVTITTVGTGGSGANNGSIEVASPIGDAGSWSAATTLSLNAASILEVTAAITNTNATTGYTAISLTANGVDSGASTNGMTVSAPLTAVGGDIYLNSTAGGTSGECYGIVLGIGGTISTTGGGSISLTGTGGPSDTQSYGILIVGGTGPRITTATGNGNISLAGHAQGTASSTGIWLELANAITSTSGNITLTGTTVASGGGAGGVAVIGAQNTGTTGTLSFTECSGSDGAIESRAVTIVGAITHPGHLSFIDCFGGNNADAGGDGVLVEAALTIGGNITSSGIEGRGNGGKGFFFSSENISAGGNIDITASGTGNIGACHGIYLINSVTLSTTSGSLSLTGTCGPSNTASYGIYAFAGTGPAVTTATGDIFLTGHGRGTNSSHGINLQITDAITSTSGAITLTGTTIATSVSHGVVFTNSQNTGSSGSFTFLNCAGSDNSLFSSAVSLSAGLTHGGNLFFTDCVGGNNASAGGNGVSISATITVGGNLTATGIQGRGNGGRGLSLSAGGINVSGSGGISITAAATGTTGNCHGISLGEGAVTTTSGNISLIGTGGPSSSSSYGISVSGGGTTPRISTAAGGDNLTLTGSASGSATSHGIFISNIMNAIAPTAGIVSLIGSTTASGSGSAGNALGDGLVTSGGEISVSGTVRLLEDISFDTTNDGGVAAGNTISFLNAINGSTAGAQSLTLNSGTSGNITFGAPIGSTIPLESLIFTSPLNGASSLVCTASTVTFNGAVGNTTPLTSLSITADAIEVHADQTVSSGAMTYAGPVALFGNTTFSKTGSGAVSFNSALSSEALASGLSSLSGNFDVEINAPLASVSCDDTIDLTGAGGSGASGGSFTVTAGGNVTLDGAVLTHGASSGGAGGSGGDVAISSTNGSISVHNIYTYGGAGATTGQGGSITLAPSSAYASGYPVGLIILNEDLGAEGNLVATLAPNGSPGAIITLDAGRSSFPTVATIVSSLAGNDIDIVCEEFIMGANEALTALGNLNIEGTTLTLSDLVALQDMTLLGDTINLLEHGDVPLLLSNGETAISTSLHWQSGGSYTSTGVLNPPDGIVDAKSLNLSSSAFLPLLTFESRILNYDGEASPPSPNPSGSSERQFMIYSLSVADAELSDSLPPLPIEEAEPVLFRRVLKERKNPPSE